MNWILFFTLFFFTNYVIHKYYERDMYDEEKNCSGSPLGLWMLGYKISQLDVITYAFERRSSEKIWLQAFLYAAIWSFWECPGITSLFSTISRQQAKYMRNTYYFTWSLIVCTNGDTYIQSSIVLNQHHSIYYATLYESQSNRHIVLVLEIIASICEVK